MNLNLTLVIEIISFLLLLFLLTKLLYKPLLKVLDERSGRVKQWLDEARVNHEQAQTLVSQAKNELEKSKEEALKIKQDTKIESDKMRQCLLEEAKKEAQRLILGTREEVERKIALAKKELREEIADLSIEIATKILGREINENDHKRIIEEGIKQISRD